MNNYNSLVFSGGTLRGISFCGCVRILEEHDILKNIKNFGGSSAGSIISSLLAIGYNAIEIKKILDEINIENMFDINKSNYDSLCKWGVCEGKNFTNLLSKLIKEKTGNERYTLQNLFDERRINLIIVGTKLNERIPVYFSPNSEYKNIPIVTAIRISISIPFIFEPVIYKGEYYIDGGIADNFPIEIFDNNPLNKVLGFKIKSNSNASLYKTIKKSLFNDEKNDTNLYRTINIITPYYPPNVFNLTDEEKQKLFTCGEYYTINFLKK